MPTDDTTPEGPDEQLKVVTEVVDRFLAAAEQKQPGVSGQARNILGQLRGGPVTMPTAEQVQTAVAELREQVRAAQAEVLEGPDPLGSGLSTHGLPEVIDEFAQKLAAEDGEGLDALIAKMEKRFEGLTGAKERAAERDAALTLSVQDSIARSLAAAGFKGV